MFLIACNDAQKTGVSTKNKKIKKINGISKGRNTVKKTTELSPLYCYIVLHRCSKGF